MNNKGSTLKESVSTIAIVFKESILESKVCFKNIKIIFYIKVNF